MSRNLLHFLPKNDQTIIRCFSKGKRVEKDSTFSTKKWSNYNTLFFQRKNVWRNLLHFLPKNDQTIIRCFSKGKMCRETFYFFLPKKFLTAGCFPNRGNRGIHFDLWTAGWPQPRMYIIVIQMGVHVLHFTLFSHEKAKLRMYHNVCVPKDSTFLLWTFINVQPILACNLQWTLFETNKIHFLWKRNIKLGGWQHQDREERVHNSENHFLWRLW